MEASVIQRKEMQTEQEGEVWLGRFKGHLNCTILLFKVLKSNQVYLIRTVIRKHKKLFLKIISYFLSYLHVLSFFIVLLSILVFCSLTSTASCMNFFSSNHPTIMRSPRLLMPIFFYCLKSQTNNSNKGLSFTFLKVEPIIKVCISNCLHNLHDTYKHLFYHGVMMSMFHRHKYSTWSSEACRVFRDWSNPLSSSSSALALLLVEDGEGWSHGQPCRAGGWGRSCVEFRSDPHVYMQPDQKKGSFYQGT